MPELYGQSRTPPKTQQFSSLLLCDFAIMCSFIISHPLYFSYFVFFSPYLLKLLSFLSPLFITTTLLLLALLTLSPSLLHPQSTTDSKVCFLLSTCHNVLEKLQTKAKDDDNDEEEDIHRFVELEAYRIVFETSTFEFKENPVEDLVVSEASRCNSEQDSVEITRPEISEPIRDISCSERVIQEISTGSENMTHNVEEKEEEKEVIKSITYSNKVEEQKEQQHQPPPFTRSESKAEGSKVSKITVNDNGEGDQHTSKAKENSYTFISTDNGGEYTSKADENTETLNGNLGSFGSMRKDKEWKRTLACKLFEERHNVDGGEGMDSLWETYETDSSKVQPKKNSNMKKGKKGGIEYNYDNDEDEEEVDGQLCCLQALKFSSGKMTLGMGKLRFSKALKGLGWLHHVSSSSKHGKKGSN